MNKGARGLILFQEVWIWLKCTATYYPALDDGPVRMEQSVAMAEKAAASGITSIIATPHHLNGQYNNEPMVVNQAVNLLHAELRKRNIRLEVSVRTGDQGAMTT